MTASTRSDLLFAVVVTVAIYVVAGPVAAAVAAVALVLLTTGVRAPLAALRDAALSAWRMLPPVGSLRGRSLSLRWAVVVFLAGVIIGRGGVALPEIRWPSIDWPIVLPDILPDVLPNPTGPLTAVVTYETFDPLSRDQYTALYAEDVRAYIAAHFAARDGHAEWRIFDDDETRLSEESDEIQAAYQQAVNEGDGPWIVIRRAGETVHSGALPPDGDALLSLLKTYGGE